MKKQIKNPILEQFSSLLDGELSAKDTQVLLQSFQHLETQSTSGHVPLQDNSAILQKINDYQRIRQALTPSIPDEAPHSPVNNIAAKVMDSVQNGIHNNIHNNIHTTTFNNSIKSSQQWPKLSVAAAACISCLMISLAFIKTNSSPPTAAYLTPIVSHHSPPPLSAKVQRPSLEAFSELASAERKKFNQLYMMHTGSAMMAGPAHTLHLARVVDLESNSASLR